jgi:NAD(P)-dependent dehydrogenase (short-subunit alcohol dehydrogenase family)
VGELDQLNKENTLIQPVPLDVTHSEAVLTAVAQIESSQGAIDLAVLNAGIYQPLPGGLGEPALFEQHMAVNYMGVINCLSAILPDMQNRKQGQVAIVASLAGYRGLPQSAAYGPSKAALINLAETLRLELSDSGIDVRLINPGFVETRLTAKNRFDMPAIMPPEMAAVKIVKGLLGQRFEISFPRRFVIWMKFARLLPYRLYFPLISRLTHS